MRSLGDLGIALGLILAFAVNAFPQCMMGSAAPMRHLAAGDPAPAFTLPGSDGNTYRLSDLKGRVVVLAWFAKAFTGG